VLAAVLLAGIVYSVSFGTVHIHGGLSQQPAADAASGFAVNIGTFVDLAGSARSKADECLICSFHRQLSFSTIDGPQFIPDLTPQIDPADAAAVFHYANNATSEPDTHLSGRAPPLVS
jgi:hypothetical protein